MRHFSRGWRSARQSGTAEPVFRPTAPAIASPPLTAGPRTGPTRAAGATPAAAGSGVGTAAPDFDMAVGAPWTGVQWTLTLIGVIGYLLTVITYRIAIGQVSMIVALVGLAFGGAVRVPGFFGYLAAYVGWAALGLVESSFPALVLDRLDLLLRLGLIALALVNALRTRVAQRLVMFVSLGAFALYPIRGTLFNYFLNGERLQGRAIWNYVYANPNDLAALCLLELGLCVALYVREPKGWPRLAAIAGFVLLPLVILLTQSRGAILALGLLVLLIFSLQKRKLRSLVILAVFGTVVVSLTPSSVWTRVSALRGVTDTEHLEEVDPEGSAEQRFEIWKVAAAMVRDHPVTGVGLGAYEKTHALYVRNGGFKRTASGERDTHNTFLNVAAETGLVGLLFFVLLFGTVILFADRVRRRVRAVLPRSAQQIFFVELSLVAYFAAGVFGSYAKFAFPYIQLAILWSIATAVVEEHAALVAGGPRPASPAPGTAVGPVRRSDVTRRVARPEA